MAIRQILKEIRYVGLSLTIVSIVALCTSLTGLIFVLHSRQKVGGVRLMGVSGSPSMHISLKENTDAEKGQHVNDFSNLCEATSKQITTVLNMVTLQQEKHLQAVSTSDPPHSTKLQFSPVTVHKFLEPPERYPASFSNYKEYTPVSFSTGNDSPLCEHARGVYVNKDRLVIQYTGLYFVYSSVKYTMNTTGNSTLPQKTSYHYVNRISPNSPANTGVLLRTAQTCSGNCGLYQQNIYAGGIFYLNRDDVIKVSLTDPLNVEYNNQASYVGLFMLAGMN